jgi:hypothetical protein
MKAYHKRRAVLRFFFLAALLACIFDMAFPVNCSALDGQEEQHSKPCKQPGTEACEGTPFAFSHEAGKKIPTAGTSYNVIGASAASNPVVYFFKGDGCPKCAEEERFLEALSKKP